eukprot:Awhi_evm1s3707
MDMFNLVNLEQEKLKPLASLDFEGSLFSSNKMPTQPFVPQAYVSTSVPPLNTSNTNNFFDFNNLNLPNFGLNMLTDFNINNSLPLTESGLKDLSLDLDSGLPFSSPSPSSPVLFDDLSLDDSYQNAPTTISKRGSFGYVPSSPNEIVMEETNNEFVLPQQNFSPIAIADSDAFVVKKETPVADNIWTPCPSISLPSLLVSKGLTQEQFYSRCGPDSDEENRLCFNCATEKTPLWRRNDVGQFLCNACGLYLKTYNVNRPLKEKKKRKTSTTKKSTKNSNDDISDSDSTSDCSSDNDGISDKKTGKTYCCANCSCTKTTLWRRDSGGNTLCNPCGLYLKLHNKSRPANLLNTGAVPKKRKRTWSSKKQKTVQDKVQKIVKSDPKHIKVKTPKAQSMATVATKPLLAFTPPLPQQMPNYSMPPQYQVPNFAVQPNVFNPVDRFQPQPYYPPLQVVHIHHYH